MSNKWEGDMPDTPADRIKEKVKSAFPEGAIEQVQLLAYGDDPGVEPGETGIRILVSRAGRPEGEEADKEIMRSFGDASHEILGRLGEDLSGIGWIEVKPYVQDESTRCGGPFGTGPVFRVRGGRGPRAIGPEDLSEQLTPVMTRLGAADLATVDTLIAAGIANSRAEILRWAVGRIRENPAYAQIQGRVREIGELKSQF